MQLWLVCALIFRAMQSTHILFVAVHNLDLVQVKELVAALWLITKPVPLVGHSLMFTISIAGGESYS